MAYKAIGMHVKIFNVPAVHVLKYQREKGAIHWEVKILENIVTGGGKNDNWVGNCSPGLYVKRGPGITTRKGQNSKS